MTRSLFFPSTWPITLKAPLIVALFMIVTSGLISSQVLKRLITTQERHLEELSGAYFDGLSSSIIPYVLREDVWEVYDALERTRRRYRGLTPIETIVLDAHGRVLAASDPARYPTSSKLKSDHRATFDTGGQLVIDEAKEQAHVLRELTYQKRVIGRIFTLLDISKLLAERQSVFMTLIWTNVLLTLLLGTGGYLVVRRIVAPVATLDDYLGRGLHGTVERIPAHLLGKPHSEFGRLFRRYNKMVGAVNERQELASQLAREEKLAILGRLTSGIAHEINNPLGGMLNAVDALRRHGERKDVRLTSTRLLERGLHGIRDVVRAALATYRREEKRRDLRAPDLDDLRLLIQPELRRKPLTIEWHNSLNKYSSYGVPADRIRQIVLNLLLNACAAAPHDGVVSFSVEASPGMLSVKVRNTGSCLHQNYRDFLEAAQAPLVPLQESSGLGIWMIRRLADEIGAKIVVTCPDNGGTQIYLSIPLSQDENRHAA